MKLTVVFAGYHLILLLCLLFPFFSFLLFPPPPPPYFLFSPPSPLCFSSYFSSSPSSSFSDCSAHFLAMASPFFLPPVKPVPCYCMAGFCIKEFGSIFLHSVFPSTLWLSNGPHSSKILPRIHFGILLLNTLTTFPAHCNLLTCVCLTRLLSLYSLCSLLSLLYDIIILFSLPITYFLVFCTLNH